ncbi:MAG: SDR family NAD(P)-dependent oxidoreductase [Candidatus Eisenbacteria bacterium]
MATVFVTGANRGLGLAFARHYHAAGWEVIATCRRPDRASALRELRGVRIEELDLCAPLTIETLVNRAHYERRCVIDVLIANAAVLPRGIRDPRLQLERALETNTFGTLRLAEGLRPCVAMGTRPVMAFLTEPVRRLDPSWDAATLAYMLSKAALNARLAEMATANATVGITTVGLYPGQVRTELGGPDAPLTAERSVAGMTRVLEALPHDGESARFDHTGRALVF